ncbi:hypothetical protein OROGR_010728 [Orobanche gracilis]
MVGIKHRHNLVRDTLLDVFFRSGISAGKEVDIGLRDGSDRSLRPADLLLYAWDRGRDVCVDLTGSSPLTQSGMMDFVPGQVVAKAVKHKCEKYRDLCAAKGYGFLPFSFSILGELDADAVALLVRFRGFALTQDAGARAAHHTFSRISFAIAKGVGAQLVSRFQQVAAIRPAMLYGSECWAMKKSPESKLEAAEMRMLRWSCGRTMMDRIPNKVFRNVLKVAPISAKVREGRLRWFEHVRRRLASAPVKRVESLLMVGGEGEADRGGRGRRS